MTNLELPPDQGLGPQNQLWRKWVEKSLTSASQDSLDFRNGISNTLLGVESSMALLTNRLPQAAFDSTAKFVNSPPVSFIIDWQPERFATIDITDRAVGWAAVTVSCQVFVNNTSSNGVQAAIGFSDETSDPNTDIGSGVRDRVLTPPIPFGETFSWPFSFTGIFNFVPGQTQTVSARVGYVDGGTNTTSRNFSFREFFLEFTPIPNPNP